MKCKSIPCAAVNVQQQGARINISSSIHATNLANHATYSYDLLWSSYEIKWLDEAISSIPFETQYNRQPAENLPDLPVPQFANSNFVGTDFASEAAQRYFRALTGAEIDYRCVRANLDRERFGPMYLPFKKVVNPLIISVGDDSWVYTFGQIQYAKAMLIDSLDSLLTLKDDPDMKIIIYLSPNMQYRKMFFEFLEIARPFFYQLRDANMDVKILGYDFFNPIEDDTKDVFSEQLNCYFDRTPEEWLDMKAKEIREVKDAKQRRACRGVRTLNPKRNSANDEPRY